MTMIIDVHGHTDCYFAHSRFNDSRIEYYIKKYNISRMMLSSARALMYDLEAGNRKNYEFIRSHDWAYGYIVINPNDVKGSEEELKKYLGREKIVGLKFHPLYCKYPVDGENAIRLFRIADSYGLCSLVHIDHNDVARPSRLLRLAETCPNSRFILAHMGNLLWKEALETVLKASNIYMDIVSSWMAFDRIKYACSVVGTDKILYGSDLGLFDPAVFIGYILSSELSNAERKKIFYENAMKAFGFLD